MQAGHRPPPLHTMWGVPQRFLGWTLRITAGSVYRAPW